MEFDKTMSFNFEKEKNTKTKEILKEVISNHKIGIIAVKENIINRKIIIP